MAIYAAMDVDYLKAHGTGTSLGDPIEIQAAARVFGEGRSQDRPLLIGSVKTNIGHLEAAAGIAGLIKLVLCMQHGVLPRHLHFRQPNPHIPWDHLPVAVTTEATRWGTNGKRPIAGVSSFGFSGTNPHVLLEGPPPVEQRVATSGTGKEPAARTYHLLPLSGKSDSALQELAGRYVDWLSGHPEANLADVCFTAGVGRSHLERRAALVVGSVADASELCVRLQRGESGSGLVSGEAKRGATSVWLFGDETAAAAGISVLRRVIRELSEQQPVFREVIEQFDQLLRTEFGVSLEEDLRSDTSATGSSTSTSSESIACCLEYAVQVAMSRLWTHWGIEPEVVFGVGVGEYAAACMAGVFSRDDGLRLVARRAASAEEFARFASTLDYQPPQRTLVCSLSGEVLAADELLDAAYWIRQTSERANRARVVQTLSELNSTLVLEAGSPSGWSGAIIAHWPNDDMPTLVSSLGDEAAASRSLLTALGQLYVHGPDVTSKLRRPPRSRTRFKNSSGSRRRCSRRSSLMLPLRLSEAAG